MSTVLTLSISRHVTYGSYVLLLLTILINLCMQGAPWIIYCFSLLPLAMFIPGMCRDTVRNLIWMGFVLLLYFVVAVYKVSVAQPLALDIVELILTITLFCAAMLYARIRQVHNIAILNKK